MVSTASIAKLAVEKINRDPNILNGVNLVMTFNDDKRDPQTATSIFLEQINLPRSSPPIGIVGPRSSRVCTGLNYAASWYKIPQVSYFCTAQTLSNKPFFFRGVPSDTEQVQVMFDLLRYFGFDKVATIFSTDEYGSSFQTVRGMMEALS